MGCLREAQDVYPAVKPSDCDIAGFAVFAPQVGLYICGLEFKIRRVFERQATLADVLCGYVEIVSCPVDLPGLERELAETDLDLAGIEVRAARLQVRPDLRDQVPAGEDRPAIRSGFQ